MGLKWLKLTIYTYWIYVYCQYEVTWLSAASMKACTKNLSLNVFCD